MLAGQHPDPVPTMLRLRVGDAGAGVLTAAFDVAEAVSDSAEHFSCFTSQTRMSLQR